jgi:uncharacterized membrane protein YfcA
MTGYPIVIYILMPFCSAIVNLTGNSFGTFKVSLLMDALNYSESAATRLTYPLILGTALFNFFRLIFKRHPSKPTSLVDYNIVAMLIPNVLFGSTIGTLLNSFIPPIVAQSLTVVLLIYFSYKFGTKLRALMQEREDEEIEEAKAVES